jgi:hypothetical protein
VGNCAGGGEIATAGSLLIPAYLAFFVHFYLQTYKKPAPKPEPTIQKLDEKYAMFVPSSII